jgi:hypothetical protein
MEAGMQENPISFQNTSVARVDDDRRVRVDRRVVLAGLGMAPVLSGALLSNVASAQETATGDGFSFAAVGDTRPMMYLPNKDGQPDLVKMFVEMFGLVMPEKMAEAVVKQDVKMIFDPATKELIQVVMPFESRSANSVSLTKINGSATGNVQVKTSSRIMKAVRKSDRVISADLGTSSSFINLS